MRLILFAIVSVLLTINQAEATENQTRLSVRFASFDRSFDNTARDRTQTGTGLILNHKISTIDKRFSVGLAGYAAQNWSSSGFVTEDVFKEGVNQVHGFSQLGEAYIDIKPNDDYAIKLGRFQYESLLLESKTRVLPSSFQGLHTEWKPSPTMQLYGVWINKWSRRANDQFTDFTTELDSNNKINWLAIAGVKSKINTRYASLSLQAEVLESADFLRKAGVLITSRLIEEGDKKLELELGAFTSRDAGSLFVSGANGTLDVASEPIQQQARLNHRGFGYFLRLLYSTGPHQLEIAQSAFDEPWLEDSFANDHGTTPFPTRTFGPELTNQDETVRLLGYRYSVKSGLLKGLSANLRHARGTGAVNSISRSLGSASEQWTLLDIRYRPPAFDKLKFRLAHRDYKSDIFGSVNGVKGDRKETRFFIDYQHQF